MKAYCENPNCQACEDRGWILASNDQHGLRVETDESLRDALQEDQTIELFDDRARYGRFDGLEDFLVSRGIHFDLHCDAYSEYDGENVYFRGGQRVLSLPASQEGNILIRHEDVVNIINNNDLDDHGKLEALTKLVNPPETKPLKPIKFV